VKRHQDLLFIAASYRIDVQLRGTQRGTPRLDGADCTRSILPRISAHQAFIYNAKSYAPRSGDSRTAPSTASSTPPTPQEAACLETCRDGLDRRPAAPFVRAIVPSAAPPAFTRCLGMSTCCRPRARSSVGSPDRSHGQFGASLYVGPKLQGQLESTAPELGTGGRLRPAVVPVDCGVSVLDQVCTAITGKLGRGSSCHLPAEARVLSAVGGERPLDGEMKTMQPRIKNLQGP